MFYKQTNEYPSEMRIINNIITTLTNGVSEHGQSHIIIIIIVVDIG